MTSKDFIISSINYLVSKFSWISCRYEFKMPSKTHFIEVLPKETYEGNSEYANEENKIVLEFVTQFPNESICFITEGSAIEVTNPEYSLGNTANLLRFTGLELKTILQYSNQEFFPVLNSNDFNCIVYSDIKPNNILVFDKIALTEISNVVVVNEQLTYIEGETILPEIDQQQPQLPLAA